MQSGVPGSYESVSAELKSPTSRINQSDTIWEIPVSSNSVELNGEPSSIFRTGLHNWTGSEKIRIYFHVNGSCDLKFALKCKVPDGNSRIQVNVLGVSQVCQLSGPEYHVAPVGQWQISGSGIVSVDIQGVEKSGGYFADVTHLVVAQELMDKDAISFLDDGEENFLYWNKMRIFEKFDYKFPSNENELVDVPRAEFVSFNAEIDEHNARKIPFSSNSVMLSYDTTSVLFDYGIHNWTSNQSVRIYFYVNESCELNLALYCKVPTGSSKVEVTVLGLSKVFELSGSHYHNIPIGKWKISGPGCVNVDLKGIEKTGAYVADITHLVIGKERMEEHALTFLSDSDKNVRYWMRMTRFIEQKTHSNGHGALSEWKIPFSSNSIKMNRDTPTVVDKNIRNWSANEIIRLYLFVKNPGEVNISLKYKAIYGKAKIEVKLLDVSREISLSDSAYHTMSIGKWDIPKSGCITVDFRGIEKAGDYFPELIYLIVSQDDMQDNSISFLDDSDESIHYWHSRFPPQCHYSDFDVNDLSERIHATFMGSNLDLDEHSAFWEIPYSSNSVDLAGNSSCVSDSGIHNWTSDAHIRMYFFVKRACNLNIALKCKVPTGRSKIRVRVLGVSKEHPLQGSEYHNVPLGKWQISGGGCVTVDLEGIEKTHSCFADITDLVVYKEDLEEDAISYLKQTEQNILYWKRLGPYHDNVGEVYNSIDVFGKDSVIWEIPFSSNSVEINGYPSTIYSTGIHNWLRNKEIRLYFYINKPCELNFGLKYNVTQGISKIEVNVFGNRQVFTLTGSEDHITRVGKWSIPTSGWVTVDLKGVEKTGGYYADVSHLIVSQTEMKKDSISFLGDSNYDFLYWQRRGPPRIIQDQDTVFRNITNSVRAKFVSPIREISNNTAVWKIPFSCNSTQLDKDKSVVLRSGIRNWNSDEKIRLFFYVKDACELIFALNCKVPTGNSKIIVKVLGVPKVFLLSNSEYNDVPLGKWQITAAGWVTVDLEGFQKTDSYFADVNHLVVLKENLASNTISFLNQSDEHYLYWQKIGPPQHEMSTTINKITESEDVWKIPFSSNSVESNGNSSTIFDTGIHNWCENEEISLYFYVKEPCTLSLSLRCKVPDGSSKITVNVLGTSRTFILSGPEYQEMPMGIWNIEDTLVTVDLKGVERTGDYFADVTHLIVKKDGFEDNAISFLDDSEENLRYWKSSGSPLRELNVVHDVSNNTAELLTANSKIDNYDTVWEIPFSSNSVELKGHTDSTIRNGGIRSWNSDEIIRIHFYVNAPCEIDMTVQCAVPDGSSKVEVKVLGVPQVFTFSGATNHTEPIGKWRISAAGCVIVDFRGLEMTGNYYADVTNFVVSSSDLNVGAISYLQNSASNILYWKRRGPPKIELPNGDGDGDSQDLHVKFMSLTNDIDMNSPMWQISFPANAWVLAEDTSIVSETGLQEWGEQTIRVYLHVKKSCQVDLALKCRVQSGTSDIEVNVLGEAHSFQLSGTEYHLAPIGRWEINGTGYVPVDLKGLKKEGDYYADITHLIIPRCGLEKDTIEFLDDEDSKEIYWRRRGPTVHLYYRIPEECEDAEYYYNEVMVPSGYDRVGSFFGVIAFANGYFGIQVNKVDVRKVLFSVWSPQKTDDADSLTEENQVILVNKDPETEATWFGHEGSGSQSFLRYDWRPDVTYKFLVHGRPDPMVPGYTLFSAWFEERASPRWRLVAEFSRPRGTGYLEDFCSFAENTNDHQGHTCRMAHFTNQWIRDSKGKWYEATAADFTGDNTTKEMTRLDFEGGLIEDQDGFYLKHCGFFIGKCNLGERLHRKPKFHNPFEDLITEKETEFKRNLTVQPVDVVSVPEISSDLINIPLYANGWLVKQPDDLEIIYRRNFVNWVSSAVKCHVFFYVGRPMTVDLFIRCRVPDGKSVINVNVGGVSKNVEIEGEYYHDVFVGRYKFKGRDYAQVVLKGVSKEGYYFGEVTDLVVPKDEATSQHFICIPDDEDVLVARKGPKPSLLYKIPEPELQDAVYYVEVLVKNYKPTAKIVAIGYNGGYIGIENNQIVAVSSVPTGVNEFMDDDFFAGRFFRDNTVNIMKITSDNYNATYTVSKHNNEVKSERPFKRKDDNDDISCKFMLQARSVQGSPEKLAYSVWFAQDSDRPTRFNEEMITYASLMGGFYSSVEVLQADQTHLATKAMFSHQMVMKSGGSIHEVTQAKVKVEGVVSTRVFDYDAGVQSLGGGGDGFFLRTCGFIMGTDMDGTVLAKDSHHPEGNQNFREFLTYLL